jgi:hypothetical protein
LMADLGPVHKFTELSLKPIAGVTLVLRRNVTVGQVACAQLRSVGEEGFVPSLTLGRVAADSEPI